MKTRYSLLDLLRFLAAFWVLNFHYFLGTSSDGHWYRYGNMGVQLFFIISGFVIVQSLKGKTLKDFAKNRFIRLFPLFWIICSATYIITLIIPNARPLLFIEYISSMTMLGGQFNGYVGFGSLIDASYWTLAIELIFYCAIGLFVHSFSFKRIRYFLLSWFALSVLAISFNIDDNFYIKFGLVHHAAYFIFGGSLALLVLKEAQSTYEKFLDWFLLFGSALYSTYIIHKIYLPYLSANHMDNIAVTIINALLFIAVILLVWMSLYVRNSTILKILTIIGGLSYPLYLLHQTIGNTLINYVTYSYSVSKNAFTIFFEVVIILVAFAVYVYDKKLRSLIENGLKIK